MIDPETQLVWHMDYVDHVDEKTLCDSLEDFLQRINFRVKGVVKEKWKSSTNALKSTFYTDRKKIMTTLCKKAGVKYFRFHPFDALWRINT